MPIFARTKLVIHDYCLEIPGSPLPGKRTLTLEYSGPNPQAAYYQARKIISSIFKVPESDVIEKDFRLEKKGDEEVFEVTFDVIKDMDRFSFIQISLKMKGKVKPSKEFGKEGELSLEIDGYLRTEYPQDTLWQRSLIYEMFRAFYHKVIYESTREKYRKECANLMYQLWSQLKEFLNLLPRR
jgi:hypothetical protein